MCVLRSVGAVGTFVLGLHEKRKKVPHPGLQHVFFGFYDSTFILAFTEFQLPRTRFQPFTLTLEGNVGHESRQLPLRPKPPGWFTGIPDRSWSQLKRRI